MTPSGTSNAATHSLSALIARPGVRQLIKFCIVGASSAAIDFGFLNLLHYKAGLPVALAATISFFLAICNGFYWNRKWTFRAGDGNAAKQYPKFVATNLVGWTLNLSIMTVVLILAGTLGFLHVKRSAWEIVSIIVTQHKGEIKPLTLNAAKLVATVFVTAWNFTASRLWTFKR